MALMKEIFVARKELAAVFTSSAVVRSVTLRGTLQLTAKGAGSVDQPAATLNLTADDLRLDEYEIGRLVTDAVGAKETPAEASAGRRRVR
mgnify:CR=1 FL=1